MKDLFYDDMMKILLRLNWIKCYKKFSNCFIVKCKWKNKQNGVQIITIEIFKQIITELSND